MVKAAGIVGSATMLSRVLGYVRDAVIAWFFGAGMAADAFLAALPVSNLLRRLLGEGALTSSFVPVFTDYIEKNSKEEARVFVSRFTTFFFVVLVVVTALCIWFSEPLVRLITPGFADNPEKFGLTVRLTQIMFPYMVFVGLMAVAMGVLNALRHFFAPAISPVLLNISMIGSVLIVAPFVESPAHALAASVLVGGLLQLLVQLPYLKKFGMLPGIAFAFRDPGVWKVLKLLIYSAIGLGIYQLNVVIILRFASGLSEGSVSYLYYATRLMELPLGVFGVSLATAALPALSMHASRNDAAAFSGALSNAVKLSNFICLPATAGLMALAYPITDILFVRGEFSPYDAKQTAVALLFFAVGIVPVAISRVLVSVFYSLKDTKTPVILSFFAFIFNIAMCVALVGPLKHGGLAFAASLSAFFNTVLLALVLYKRLGAFFNVADWRDFGVSMLASVVMGVAVYRFTAMFDWHALSFFGKTALLSGAIALGIGIYAAMSALFKVREFDFVCGLLKEKAKALQGKIRL